MNSGASRLRIVVRGAVQGVGFRPFVYRLARDLQLTGWVTNSAQGVAVEIEGPPAALANFLRRLQSDKPPRAIIQSCESTYLDPVGFSEFRIRESSDRGGKSALILPDIATCADCLREIFQPNDRRFRYPFTNCTNCGPRFSIIEALPYDRARTSMKKFSICEECTREYLDPADRRFHAEPIACPRCGPQLQFWDSLGNAIADKEAALEITAAAIRDGNIVALKGLGGFQLLVDARNEKAVLELRARKHREEKPFAVMFPTLEAVREVCAADEAEERLLRSPECPIVLLPKLRADKNGLVRQVAPDNPNLGAMLPCTPLHHLLLRGLNFPVVATSGNLSDEPICIDEHDALTRLKGIADFFLVHDRPIVRHVDDSIVRVIAGRELMLRRARGYAPLPITLNSLGGGQKSPTILGVGAHLKNTVALRVNENVFISQHIGDLATGPAHDAFVRAAADLPRLYEAKPDVIAHDLHPEYLSTKYALRQPVRCVGVQHHCAHVAACMAENEIAPTALGVSWDGTGYGNDGTIWGGEFLFVRQNGSFERVAHLRTFRLPGGEAAVREPRRCALGLLHEISRAPMSPLGFEARELSVLQKMLAKKINSPLTSSAGRFFDAVAALIGLRMRASFEGEAAMTLEFAAEPNERASYPFVLRDSDPIVIDWEPTIVRLLADLDSGAPVSALAAKFHNTLVEMIVAIARQIGEAKIVLSGGCFQNRLLTERTIARLREENFRPYWHQRIPPNDGGISLGQVVAASWSAP